MKKILYQMITSLCLLTAQLSVTAQTSNNFFVPPQFPSSPNSTAFSTYGNYPVSLYSGLPDIFIPLYTIESGGLKLPITLSYHASGIKISDVASWAGLGWSVNTGGSITRTVMGQPDETGYLLGTLPDHILNPEVNADLDVLYNIMDGHQDTQPDIFSFNIPGHSGRFFYNSKDKYNITQIPLSPLSINSNLDLNKNDSLSFTIRDEYSNFYSLGKTYTEQSGQIGNDNSNNGAVTSAWMLEQMISGNKRDTINFSYSPAFLIHPDCLFETLTIADQPVIVNNACSSVSGQAHGPLYKAYNNTPPVTEQQLKTILFKNGKVDFELAKNPRTDVSNNADFPYLSLSDIKISAYNFASKTYEVQKTIRFYQSYFGSDSAGNQRPRLDSLQVLDKTGLVIQRYRFGYNPLTLPAYGSLSRDFWGYYNGKQDGVRVPDGTLIPAMTVDYEPGTGVYPAPNYISIGSTVPHSREPDSAFMQACMLDTIYYPTGGHTVFSYQTNRYLDSSGNYALAGGLRVTAISSFDGISPVPITKTYQYNQGFPLFLTTGVQPVNYGFFSNTATNRNWIFANIFDDGGGIGAALCSTLRTRTYYAQTTAALEPFDGTPVGYISVTEYSGTASQNTGKTDYQYNFMPDAVLEATMSGKQITQSNFYHRGQLTRKTEYSNNGEGTYRPVKDETNTYKAFFGLDDTSYYDVGLAVGQKIFNNGVVTRAYYGQEFPDDDGSFAFDTYPITTGDNYLTGTTTTLYNAGGTGSPVTTTVKYCYDNLAHQQVTRTRVTDSKGNTRVTVNKYPLDYYNAAAQTTGNAVLDSLVNQNGKAFVVEKWDSLKYAGTGTGVVTGAQLNQYQGGSLPGTVVPFKMSTLSLSGPVTGFTPATIDSGVLAADPRYEEMVSFDLFDAHNNIIQYKPRTAGPTSVIWDYNTDLPVAQVKNSPVANVFYTSFEADGKGGWYYSGSPVADATAPTGSMVYPLSQGSVNTPYIDPGISYKLSYYSNNGPASVAGDSTTAAIPFSTYRGWTYYEQTIPAGTGQVVLSGNTAVDELRLYPANAQMTTYTYSPDGLTSTADAKGGISYDEYDNFQRLLNVKDRNGSIIKNYSYKYANAPAYYSAAAKGKFVRDNCGADSTGSAVTYTVNAGAYVSGISQQNADSLAMNDVTTNGQAYADANGTCSIVLYYSRDTSAVFTRDNCSGDSTGSIVSYYLPGGAYTSTISQDDADLKALKDIKINGQAYADSAGTCTPNNPVIQYISFSLSNGTDEGYQVNFSGSGQDTTFNMTAHSDTTILVPAGIYTVDVYTNGTYINRTFTLGSRTPVSGLPRETFYDVDVATASTDLTLSVE